jgi:hypothetical protein
VSQKVESDIQISDAELDDADNYLHKKRRKDPVADAYIKKKQRKATDHLARNWDANGARKMRQGLVEAKVLSPEQVAGLEWEAWHQRTLGKPVYKIAKEMGATVPQVNIWLQDAMNQVIAKTQGLIDLDKEIELERTERLLERYLPVALMDKVVVERIRQGEPVEEEDLEVPQHCSYIVMELIKLRCKIKGITISQAQESMLPVVDVMGWLQTQKAFIQKVVKDAPRDLLTLETETNIDETTENFGTTAGVSGAV